MRTIYLENPHSIIFMGDSYSGKIQYKYDFGIKDIKIIFEDKNCANHKILYLKDNLLHNKFKPAFIILRKNGTHYKCYFLYGFSFEDKGIESDEYWAKYCKLRAFE